MSVVGLALNPFGGKNFLPLYFPDIMRIPVKSKPKDLLLPSICLYPDKSAGLFDLPAALKSGLRV
jgi:hypothetical protein